MRPATIEAGLLPGAAMRGLGLTLAALMLGTPALAQSERPASEQQLIERLQQIQGEIGGRGASEQQLIEGVRRLQGEIAAPAAPAAEARLSAAQVRDQIAERLGVQVLGVEPTEARGRPAYAVRVMNPPGNYNAAFLVTTLLVDGTTGEILGEARALPSAARPDARPEERQPNVDSSGLELRRRTYR